MTKVRTPPRVVEAATVTAFRRERGLSRRALAELTGGRLTEGKIWRIERHGTADVAEVAVLAALIAPVDASATETTAPAAADRSAPVHLLSEEDLEAEPTTRSDHGWGPVAVLTELAASSALALPDRTRVRPVSNSEVQTFKRCRRQWWLGWLRGLRLRLVTPVGVRTVGDRVHRALAEWYVPDGHVRTDPRDALELLVRADWDALVAERGAEFTDNLELVKKFVAEADLERAMVAGYVEWLAETGADADLRVTAPETYLEAPLGPVTADGRPVVLVGKIDVRATRISDGARLFIEHKTKASFDRPVRALPRDEQVPTYIVLEVLTGAPGDPHCDGAIYNMLRRVKRTAAAKPPFYRRVEVRRNPYELDSFRRRLTGTVERMLEVEVALADGEDPLAWAYPTQGEHCSWCDFEPVCTMFDDGSRVDAVVAQYYETGDPLDHYTRP